jgi:DNA helicase-2/ATP-dependent DNA helicase PcrA
MAVLYRSHFHALELQLELTRRNIPFEITSGIRFFEQAHIKDVAAYVKFIANPRDELAFKRIVRLLNGVGGKSADKLWTAFRAAASGPALAPALQSITAAVPKKSAVGWAQFTATIAQLEAPEIRSSPSRMIELVMEAGYEEYLQDQYPNFRARQDDIEQLAAFATQFQTVENFLTQLAL